MQCVNTAGCLRRGMQFHSTHPAPWWKWRNVTGHPNIRGSQEHPFIVPTHAPLQIDFLHQAHVWATRPRRPVWGGQWNRLTALTCSVTRSRWSICRLKDDMVQTAVRPNCWTPARFLKREEALMKHKGQIAVQVFMLMCSSKLLCKHPELIGHFGRATAYIGSSPFGSNLPDSAWKKLRWKILQANISNPCTNPRLRAESTSRTCVRNQSQCCQSHACN